MCDNIVPYIIFSDRSIETFKEIQPMLDIQRIRDNPDAIATAVINKNAKADIAGIVALDGKRRELIGLAEQLKGKRNLASQEIARLKKEKLDATPLMAEMKNVSDQIKDLDAELKAVEENLHNLMIWVPNPAHESVHHGKSADDNKVIATWGAPRTFDFTPKDHLQLGTSLDILDFPRGAKISGAGFPVYKGYGALLERALINFMLDTHGKSGYTEIFPPMLVNRQSLFGTGQLPKSEEQMYYVGADDLFAIPTAEVPVTNLHRDEVLDGRQLPIKYCAFSSCFRREAGSYGKDTKGFIRVHEFHKVELVKFTTPETSYAELESLRGDAESILRALNLHYRVLALCDADISFAAAKCYDLEAFAPVEGRFLEVSSCSNYEDFQARRMNIRYKAQPDSKPAALHTLNGSALATARIMVAVLENYQTAQGTVMVPEVLQSYMHGLKEITAR